MTTHQPKRLAIAPALFRGSVALATLALLASAALAQTTYIYLESNNGKIANKNSVFAFSNDGSGNLTALAGSPYLTSGTGVYVPNSGGTSVFDADQEVITNSDGTLLYAVNGHSNSIAGFTINPDGTLIAVPGSPFASGGQNPMSVGLVAASTEFMVVANKNQDPNQDMTADLPNYTTFTANADGSLTMNAGSTLDLAGDCSPSQVLTRNLGRIFFGMEFNTSRLASYKFSADGTISEVSSLGPPTTGELFLGEILNPNRRILYVGLPATSQVGVYKYTGAGQLSFVRTVANGGAAICWLAINAAGTRLYTAETESRTISVYDTSKAQTPVLLQQLTLSGTGVGPSNIVLDPTQSFVYVLVGHTVHVINLDADGMMTETISPVTFAGASDETPLGLAVVRK